MVLPSQPTATTTVTIGGAADPAVTLDKTSLTFTVQDWKTAQTVTITPVGDAVSESLTITHTFTGGDYDGLSADSVLVSVADVDTRDVIVSTSTLALSEGQGDTCTVKLASQPTATTTVTVRVAGAAQLTANPTGLTFTTSDWDRAQTVTVASTQDDDASTNTAIVTNTASGSDYTSVTVTDDDTPGVSITPVRMSLVEAFFEYYQVTLLTKPSGPVTISINPVGDVTTNKANLLFDQAYWLRPHYVKVAAPDDDDGLGGTATVTHTVNGADYEGLRIPNINVVIVDDDTPELVLSTNTLPVLEGDMIGTSYTVRLATEPVQSVTVEVSGHSGTDLRLSTTTLNFTMSAWNVAQTVTVTAADDANAVDESMTLTHTATGGEYQDVTAELGVAVLDDAPDTVTVSFHSDNYSVSEGTTTSIEIALSADPQRSVTISVEGAGRNGATASDFSIAPASVTFASGQTRKTLVFTAIEDTDDDDGESVKLTFANLPDGVFGGANAEATVSIDDDDMANLVLSTTTLTVHEDVTTSRSYTVKLSTQQAQPVSVEITGHSGTSLRLSTTTLSFATSTWSTSQPVKVTAVDDSDQDDESGNLTHTASEGVAADLAVMVRDDAPDSVTVSFAQAGYTVSEGSTTTVTVMLSEHPDSTVTIPMTKTNLGGATRTDYSGVPDSLTFNSGDTQMSFEFSANLDDDGECEADVRGAAQGFGTRITIDHHDHATGRRYNSRQLRDRNLVRHSTVPIRYRARNQSEQHQR